MDSNPDKKRDRGVVDVLLISRAYILKHQIDSQSFSLLWWSFPFRRVLFLNLSWTDCELRNHIVYDGSSKNYFTNETVMNWNTLSTLYSFNLNQLNYNELVNYSYFSLLTNSILESISDYSLRFQLYFTDFPVENFIEVSMPRIANSSCFFKL